MYAGDTSITVVADSQIKPYECLSIDFIAVGKLEWKIG